MHRALFRSSFRLSAGRLESAIAADAEAARAAASGLWKKDALTWSADPDVQVKIANRLGWLDSPAVMAEALPRIIDFADRIRVAGFTDVVLLGMGGSSLAPEVMRAVLGVQSGFPRLHMLDSTDPAAVRAVATPPATTLFLLASKSGTTIEPNSLAAHFQRVLLDAGITQWSRHFVAITDPDTELARRAENEEFREVFINPADIGGRFSALSFFGLVPSALMGQDIRDLVDNAVAMLDEARASSDEPRGNPAVGLGLLMAAGAKSGRDKLTLMGPPLLDSFGLWVEQLVAESTGKQGLGVVPITGESVGDPSEYEVDRMYVHIRLPGESDDAREALLKRLGDAPLAAWEFPSPGALGAEFMRWEIATAIAGALLRVNPFDEPNVTQAKDATRVLLNRHAAEGALPQRAADAVTERGVSLTLSQAARTELEGRGPESFLGTVHAGDYVGILAYVGPDPALAKTLDRFRRDVRKRLRAATMFGYGPRYLHSTGQLHKGGRNNGVFVVITGTPAEDLDVPGQSFSFGTLELAQALGDFESLDRTGRRALHLHLPTADPVALADTFDRLLRGV
jgi:glucose-6-phosphate isomerase